MTTHIKVVNKRSELFEAINEVFAKGGKIGFVPTMGALHKGHVKLMEQSVRENSHTLVSIFVNPKQFGPKEDFSKYPRTLGEDVEICKKAGVAIVFAPSIAEMYPPQFSTKVIVSGMDSAMCGRARPGHFEGVTTVVALLLNLARAHKAYFGLKDFQQFSIIKKMVCDLNIPTHISGVPTEREADGLALSSRNVFLSADARLKAKNIPECLKSVGQKFLEGERNSNVLLSIAREKLNAESIELQYVELNDAKTLQPVGEQIEKEAEAVFALAVIIDGVRLIDNIVLSDNELKNISEFVGNE
jgi:pantoate--beta-alanine ligase